MKIPTLLLAVYQKSTVLFDCLVSTVQSQPALFRLDVASPATVTATPESLTLGTPQALQPGLYHLQGPGNLCCKVVSGDCTVVVVNGEDPWPTPPSQLGPIANYESAMYSYFHRP